MSSFWTACLLYSLFLLPVFGHKRHHTRRSSSISYDERYLGFRFIQEPTSGLPVDGVLLLNCVYIVGKEASHFQDVRLEWKRDGSLINAKSGRVQLFSNGSMSINDMTSSDEGSYRCAVHITSHDGSIWSFISRKATIRLPELPRFEYQPSNRFVSKGQPVSFHCSTQTKSNTTVVTWYHNKKNISSGVDYHILPISNSLEISSVQPRHEGDYMCDISGAGMRRSSHVAKLKVETGPNSSPLTFISQPMAQSVSIGSDFILECLVTGQNNPLIRWLKDSRPIMVDGLKIRHIGVASLLVTEATLSDGGLYTCRASDTDDSFDKTITIQIKSLPHITTHPEDKVTLETADVELECVASGRPQPVISWYKNGEAIIASEYFVIHSNRLQILGVVKTDQGVYQCVAENEEGSVQSAAQLLVDSAGPTYLSTLGLENVTIRTSTMPMPADDSSSLAASSGQPLISSAPLGLRALTIGSRFVTLEWDPPIQRHGHIMRYHIFYKEDNSDRERMINSSGNSVTLTSLQPNTLYLIKVAAENEAGMGKIGDHIKVTTIKELSVPGKVANLKAYSLGPETIEVKWDPPNQDNTQTLRYKVFYIRNPPGNDKETQTIISETSYTLHGMDKFTEYLIRVEAEGENGSGLSSETIKIRTQSDVPSTAPNDIRAEAVSSTSVRVSWKEADDDTTNGVITGYRLKYKPKLRGSKGNSFVIDATEKEYTITGLDANTQYLVRMAIINHNGTGPYSDWLRVDTPLNDKEEVLLGAPRELRPAAGSDHILLHWLPPADEAIMVRGYQIGWGINLPDLSTARVAANVLQYKITGLRPGKEYVVSLRAFNNQGNGFPIYETLRTVEYSSQKTLGGGSGVPVATPLGVRADTQSAHAIRVSWSEADHDAFNTEYQVRYSTSADGNLVRYLNSTELFASLEGLQPATEYEVAVRAMTSTGDSSEWSMAARNKTLSLPPSSAPRDLIVLPASSGDPHSVTINWQPPKYANGEIEEYLIHYTDRSDMPDKDWTINYVPGDRMSHQANNIMPKTIYYFKIQARNELGYGPLSSVVKLEPRDIAGAIRHPPSHGSNNDWQHAIATITSNPLYMIVIGTISLLIILSIILITLCLKKSSKPKPAYIAGKKQSTTQPGNGLWIDGRNGASDYMLDGPSICDMKHLREPEVVDSPPPRYQQALQDSAYGSVSARQSRTPIRQSVSSYEEGGDSRRPLVVGRARPILASVHSYGQSEDSQGTLSRSYHHSSTSLEGQRQRTPQVVYTGMGRHQPIAKIDFSDSPYGSSTGLAPSTPPLPMQAPPNGPPIIMDGYRTLRSTPPAANSLRSFTQLAAAAPPPPSQRVVIAAGGRQVPVGRAAAQPRVNVANIYNSYATCSSDAESDKKSMADIEMQAPPAQGRLQETTASTEELNAQMNNLDTMIDDLQALQNEFGGVA